MRIPCPHSFVSPHCTMVRSDDESDFDQNGEPPINPFSASNCEPHSSAASALKEDSFQLSERSAAIVRAAKAAGHKRSDSMLSGDDDSDFGEASSTDRTGRNASFAYMEEASMEASLLNHLSEDASAMESTRGGTLRPMVTKLSPSGRLGRRRTESLSSDEVLVGGDLEGIRKAPSNDLDASYVEMDFALGDALPSPYDTSETFPIRETSLMTSTEIDDNGPKNVQAKAPVVVDIGQIGVPNSLSPSSLEPTYEILKAYRIIDDRTVSDDILPGAEAKVLCSLFDGFCCPPLELDSARAILKMEMSRIYSKDVSIPIPEQPVIQMLEKDNRVVSLLLSGVEPSPAILQLPLHFAASFLRILVRLLTHETDPEYNQTCFLIEKDVFIDRGSLESPPVHPDHFTSRPHMLYSSARFQCVNAWKAQKRELVSDSQIAVEKVLDIWEQAAATPSCALLLGPLGRLLGVLGAAGVNAKTIRRVLDLGQALELPILARVSIVRALTTAATGSSRSLILPKLPPENFFLFGQRGLKRKISGLSTWPFRNDFGVAVWFRAEHFGSSSNVTLISARSDDGGGIEVSLVPLDEKTNDVCTVSVSVFDSGNGNLVAHSVKVSACVLLPRVWYHLAVRHTRSRLKGVFSLSTRQQVSIMVDGKVMLTAPLPFPRISDSDFEKESILQSSLRRVTLRSSLNLTLEFGSQFDGQAGTVYIFNDTISDASFRTLFELSGGSSGALKRSSSRKNRWDSRRSEIVRKSKALDMKTLNDEADELVVSQRKKSGSRQKEMKARVVDLLEADEIDDNELALELQNPSFGSKIFVVWDPERVTDSCLAIELHVGAHVQLEQAYRWFSNSAQDVISYLGGMQLSVPLFRSLLSDRATVTHESQRLELAFGYSLQSLVDLISSCVKDHDENARELLRCGALDVYEHVLTTCRNSFLSKPDEGSVFQALNSNETIANSFVLSLLRLRSSCEHYVGLEAKIFSRFLFNFGLWIGTSTTASALDLALLPILAILTRSNGEKVRDCLGSKYIVQGLCELEAKGSTSIEVNEIAASKIDKKNLFLAMLFDILVIGTSPRELAPFLNFLSSILDAQRWETIPSDGGTSDPHSSLQAYTKRLAIDCSIVLFMLLQVRPPVNGLYMSLAHCCGSVQGGAAWILSSLVNSTDDNILSLGVRSICSYLELASKGPDSGLAFGPILPSEPEAASGTDVSSSVRRGANRMAQIAKGIAAMGPTGSKGTSLYPKLTARVIFKLLWHLLRSHRSHLGPKTRVALLFWIMNGNNLTVSAIGSIGILRRYFVTEDAISGYQISFIWAEKKLLEVENVGGHAIQDALAVGTVLRLLRYLDSRVKDQWLSDLLDLARGNRKSLTVLASVSDWEASLFHLASETLESFVAAQNQVDFESKTKSEEFNATTTERSDNMSTELSFVFHEQYSDSLDALRSRLDTCVDLYATLLGHILREGGNKALSALENVSALERVCVNGHTVLLLLLSSLCANVFENGTLLEIGSISAEDWHDVDLEAESLPLKQSARLVTDAILSNGMKGLDMTTAVRSWRSLRHLTEVVVALATKSGLGVASLFDYSSQKASAVDIVSNGLHGIRLPESKVKGISAYEYGDMVKAIRESALDGAEKGQDIDRRLCVNIAAQVLTLLDAFIFPDSLDSSLPASHIHGLALVRSSEPRLGPSQGTLLASAIRLSLILLALLEPSSVKLLQCASRLKCLLFWALELVREEPSLSEVVVQGNMAMVDRLLLATVLHCHRALGRCSALLIEVESSPFETYFASREDQKRHHRRLLRVSLELRDIASTVFRGRNHILKSSLSPAAYGDLQASLEGDHRIHSKEGVVREFLCSRWVTKYQDIETRADIAVPEQATMGTIALNSEGPTVQGFIVIEKLAQEAEAIVVDYEKALHSCFESYLESQRKWAETDAVRDLEYDGDTITSRLSDRHDSAIAELTKAKSRRRNRAELRWHRLERKVVEPWKLAAHWKLAQYSDPIGRRLLMVQNRYFDSHEDASYEVSLGKERDREEEYRSSVRLEREKKDLAEVMRRNADAFIVENPVMDCEPVEDDTMHAVSDSEGSTDLELVSDTESNDVFGRKDADDTSANSDGNPDEVQRDEEWDKIGASDIDNIGADGDIDGWAKIFMWSESESVVARFENVMLIELRSYTEGKVLLTNHGIYFRQIGDEMNVMTKEPLGMDDTGPSETKDRRWRLCRLSEIQGRRYMLRQQALEMFFADGQELFINFPAGGKDRDRFYAKIRNSCKIPMLCSPKSLNPRVIFRRSKLMDQWRKRKLSNFDYLIALNRLAGRSFNDITQYPVMPWILADFTSDNIDLSDSRVYRDLSKPIGALNPDRLAQLLERYKDLELFGFTEAEKFLYGSHYSSPGIILHFLIRQEPFTSMAIDLQSGRFDCPDRLFFDIAASWNSCMTSTSDMKELIPEFFCLPEMYLNTNEFPLGRTQNNRLVDNVGLPPWAKGSPHEFIRIQRLALESENVSRNLHQWIDLIFGYKQRGPEAEAAHNIFHHLSYEGSVDLDKITDEIDRQAAESHIQNFGQTPCQLLTDYPHPARYTAEESWTPLLPSAKVRKLRFYTPSKQFANKRSEYAKGTLTKVHVFSDTILAVYSDMSVGTYRWFPSAGPNNRLRMDKLRAPVGRSSSTSRTATKRGSVIPPTSADTTSILSPSSTSFAVSLGGRAKEELRRNSIAYTSRLMSGSDLTLAGAEASALLVSCGYWDHGVRVHGLDNNLRVLATEAGGHRGPILCLAVAQDDALMVTGGEDCTCRVWVVDHSDLAVALSDGYVQTALGSANTGESVLSCCHVLWGHETPITCVALDSALDVVISGSREGKICVHTLRRGEFVRFFTPPVSGGTPPAIARVALHPTGTVVVHARDQSLHAFSVNGVRLASVNAGEELYDLQFCNEFVVTGGTRGQVCVRSLSDLQIQSVVDLSRHGPVHCLALTNPELNPIPQFLFVGSADGMLTIVDVDPTQEQQHVSDAVVTL